MEDGSTDRTPELVVTQDRFRNHTHRGEVIARVKHIVANKLVERTVELVCPGPGREVDHAAQRKSVLGREDAALHLELLDRIDGGVHRNFARRSGKITLSVQDVGVGPGGRPVDRNS